MKRKYIQPSSQVIRLAAEPVMLTKSDEKVTDGYTDSEGNEQKNLFSNDKVFSGSEIWDSED